MVPDRFAEPREGQEVTQDVDISCWEFQPVGRGAFSQ